MTERRTGKWENTEENEAILCNVKLLAFTSGKNEGNRNQRRNLPKETKLVCTIQAHCFMLYNWTNLSEGNIM